MGTIVRGLICMVLIGCIMIMVILVGVEAIATPLANWRISANQADIAYYQSQTAGEWTKQVTVSQENETLRHTKSMDTLVELEELRQDGETARTDITQSTVYWTSWTSVAHRILVFLSATAALLWFWILYLSLTRKDNPQ